MVKLLIQGIILIFLWFGSWGIMDIAVDNIAGDNTSVRFATYFTLILLGILILWAVEVIMPD